MGLIKIYPVYFNDTYNLLYQGTLNLVTGLAFLIFVPLLSALTMTMFVYKLRQLKRPVAQGGSLAVVGIVPGLFTSTCTSCVPLLLLTLGVSYGTFSAFLAPFVIGVRIVSLAILTLSFYLVTKSINKICKNIRR